MLGVVKREVQILHNLRKEEALRIVNEPRVDLRDVIDARVRPIHGRELLQALCSGMCAVEVFSVACDTPRVEVALKHFGAQDVVGCGDVEAVLVVECELACVGRCPAREAPVWPWRDESKSLWADTSAIYIEYASLETSGHDMRE